MRELGRGPDTLITAAGRRVGGSLTNQGKGWKKTNKSHVIRFYSVESVEV